MTNVRDSVITFLRQTGMTVMFGNPGSTELPLYRDWPEDFRYVLGLQESVAIFIADGYARATGKPAAVLVTSGPGAGNTVTGLMTAQMDSVPMIIICGQQVTWMLGKDAFQEAGVTGYTVVPVLGGSGRSGRWSSEGQVGLSGGMVQVICIIRPDRLDQLLETTFDLVERHIGVVSVSDCEVLRAERF